MCTWQITVCSFLGVVSHLHETLIRLLHDSPNFLAVLLSRNPAFDQTSCRQVTMVSENATLLQLMERRVDGVAEVHDGLGRRLIVAVEVQLAVKEDKTFSWPTYVARLRERMRCPVALLVLCVDKRTADWGRQPIELGPGSVITPLVVGPDDIPRVVDAADPDVGVEMTVLSTIFHGDKPGGEEVIDAMTVALSTIDPDVAADYTEYALGLLQDGRARNYLEVLMTTATFEYQSEFTRRLKAEGEAIGEARGEAIGEARGEARGEAKSLLRLLALRGVEVPEAVRERITSCGDTVVLERWFDRAMEADSAWELFDSDD